MGVKGLGGNVLPCLRRSKKTSVAGVDPQRYELVRDEIRGKRRLGHIRHLRS